MLQAVEVSQLDNRHFGLVVRDLEKTLAYYATLGLDLTLPRQIALHGKLQGKPSSMHLKIALSVGGSVQTEIIEAAHNAIVHTDSLTLYRFPEAFGRQPGVGAKDFSPLPRQMFSKTDIRGDGGHHIGIFVSDLAAEIERWSRVGVYPLFQGTTPTVEATTPALCCEIGLHIRFPRSATTGRCALRKT